MKRYPNLRGRYDGSVLSPLQWSLLAVIGYVAVMGFQLDTLLHTSFSIELFDHEVARVEHAPRPAVQTVKPITCRLPVLLSAEDWPAPPIQTRWSSEPEAELLVDEIRSPVPRR